MSLRPERSHDFRWGIERETHRVLPNGSLSPTPHPVSLKAPEFTKDFAESQLELVTGPRGSIAEAVGELEELTKAARGAIGDELLWPFSMPPLLADGEAIRTARMGSGEGARLAERYRAGLSARYGAARQLICGVHVNVSFGDGLLEDLRVRSPLAEEETSGVKEAFAGGKGSETGASFAGGERDVRALRDAYYLRLVRNLFDDLPSLVMLFGATPFDASARDASGLRIRVPGESGFAYSVRNSPRGYARTEYRPFLDLDSIANHIAGIRRGMNTESAVFGKLGLIRDGRPVQLNGRFFQKEKEFYAPIRFKRTPLRGESALRAIERRGVEYIELRFFDVDPFAPAGITEDALDLAHLFILDGLARVSTARGREAIAKSLRRADEAALSDPFMSESGNVHLASLLRRLDSLEPIAREAGAAYERALEAYRERFARTGGSPSAALALGFLERGLEWNRYGAQGAPMKIQGEGYGFSA